MVSIGAKVSALFVCVFVICLLLYVLVPVKKRTPPRPELPAQPFWTKSAIRGKETGDEATSKSSSSSSLTDSRPDEVNGSEREHCSVNQDLKVLGKVLDRCSTKETSKLIIEEDVHISVKTTNRFHSDRVLPNLQTWFQAVPVDRLHVITDGVPDTNDTLYQIATKSGIDLYYTDCRKDHSRVALCCKSRNEYFRYYNLTTASGGLHKWYCHFDDDMYVNIKELVPALREGLRRSKDGGVYVGRFPNDTIRSNLNGIRISRKSLNNFGFDYRNDLYVKWGAGAAYCLTSVIMEKIRELFSKHPYEEFCNHFVLPDDITAALLVRLSGYQVSHTEKIRTQSDRNRKTPLPMRFEELITIASGRYSDALKDDPSKFLAYHCLLYPSTYWCPDSRNQ